MEKNQIGKYLKYAIGEIILVVIGILIALQINNWNENRKDREKEQVVLKKLHQDFRDNLTQLEEKMATRSKILTSSVQLLKAFDKPAEVSRDNVIRHIAIINNDPTFDPIENDLSNSSTLVLISNQRLNYLLANWSSDADAVQEIEQTWSDKSNGPLDDITSELGIGRDISNSFIKVPDHLWLLDDNVNFNKVEIGPSKLGSPLNEILTDKKLEAMIASAFSLNNSANLQSEALRKRILEILELIESEIRIEKDIKEVNAFLTN